MVNLDYRMSTGVIMVSWRQTKEIVETPALFTNFGATYSAASCALEPVKGYPTLADYYVGTFTLPLGYRGERSEFLKWKGVPEYRDQVPTDPNEDILVAAYNRFCADFDIPKRHRIEPYKGIPVAKGLSSSSASVLGPMFLVNELERRHRPFDGRYVPLNEVASEAIYFEHRRSGESIKVGVGRDDIYGGLYGGVVTITSSDIRLAPRLPDVVYLVMWHPENRKISTEYGQVMIEEYQVGDIAEEALYHSSMALSPVNHLDLSERQIRNIIEERKPQMRRLTVGGYKAVQFGVLDRLFRTEGELKDIGGRERTMQFIEHSNAPMMPTLPRIRKQIYRLTEQLYKNEGDYASSMGIAVAIVGGGTAMGYIIPSWIAYEKSGEVNQALFAELTKRGEALHENIGLQRELTKFWIGKPSPHGTRIVGEIPEEILGANPKVNPNMQSRQTELVGNGGK